MGRDVVLVGAGHAHLQAVANLHRYISKGGHATVIHPSPFLYNPSMAVGMLSGLYLPKETRFHVRRLTQSQGGLFLEGEVGAIDPEQRVLILTNGRQVNYDVVSFGIGSEVKTGGLDISYANVFRAKPVEQLFYAGCALIDALKKETGRVNVVVVGGGAAGVEIALNAWEIAGLFPGRVFMTLVTRGHLLRRFSARARKLALKSLAARKISIIEGMAVKGNTATRFLLENGTELAFDIAIVATGIQPPALFSRCGMPVGPDGGLLVNRFLQSVRYPEIFGGGDCIHFKSSPLSPSMVYTMKQNEILYENLDAALIGGTLKPFSPPPNPALILNTGNGRGIFIGKYLSLGGRIPFMLKNYRDRKFMEEFQLAGELSEGVSLD